MRPSDYIEIFAFLVELCGLVFLYGETRRAQESEKREQQKSAAELEEIGKSRSDLKDTADARHDFRKILTKWLIEKEEMDPDEAAIMARRVLGLNQSAPRLILPAWLDINYVAPRLLKHRTLLLAVGTALLVLAVLIHGILFTLETRKPPEPIAQAPISVRFTSVSSNLVFDPGQALLQYSIGRKTVDLTADACTLKKALAATGAQNALVIGRHDRVELRRTALATYSSNEALAQRRADEISKYLTETDSCGPGIRTAVALTGGPRLTGKRAVHEADLGSDRSVEVWAIAP